MPETSKDPHDKAYRSVTLDERDLADLDRLLGKIRDPSSAPAKEATLFQDLMSEAPDLHQRARQLLERRQRRIAIFGAQMFAEPGWDMLLMVYLSDTGTRLTQSSLSEMSGSSRSTAMRWIDYLESRDLIRRDEHPTDRRQVFVSLTQTGRNRLELYLSETG